MSLTPQERSLRARIASLDQKSHPDYDGGEATRAAKEAYWARYHDQVDPRRQLTPAERDRRAKAAWQADMARARLARSRKRTRNQNPR